MKVTTSSGRTWRWTNTVGEWRSGRFTVSRHRQGWFEIRFARGYVGAVRVGAGAKEMLERADDVIAREVARGCA